MATTTAARLLALLLATTWAGGCVDTRLQARKHTIRVETQPPGAQVWVQSESGKLIVDESPVEIEREYQTETQTFSRGLWATVAASAVAAGLGGTSLYYSTQPGVEGYGPLSGGISLGAIGAVGLVVSLYYCIRGEGLDGTSAPVSQQITVGADLTGHQTQSQAVEIPGHTEPLSFSLPPLAIADRTPLRPDPDRTIVAVFDIKDDTGKLEPGVAGRLTEYLATALVQQGAFRVVPREQLRTRLAQEKVGSYKACYDQGCQIELGKAVAAGKTLATTLMPIGGRCTLTANLLDLKTETAEKGAKATADCGEEALARAIDQLAEQLSR